MPGKTTGAASRARSCSPNGRLGEWIRPVSSRVSGALSEHERIYLDRTEPALLDIVEVSLDRRKPESHQVENWLIAQDHQCKRKGSLPFDQLAAHVDSPEEIWPSGHSAAGHRDDRVPKEQADRLESSLLLVKVDRMEVTQGKKLRGGKTCWVGSNTGRLGITTSSSLRILRLRRGTRTRLISFR